MMRACAAVLAFTALLSQGARADVHCYTFRNDAAGVTSLSFAYSPVTGGVVTGVAIDSGKTYPFDGRPWCWNLPAGSSATVTVSGSGVPGWTGKLVLGNGAQTADSGTYLLTGAARAGAPAAAAAAATPAVAASAAVAAAAAGTAPAAAGQAQSCLANAFPNGNRYCLTALKSGLKVRCGTGHTGRSGTLTVEQLTLTCPGRQSLTLLCMEVLGGRQQCDLNEQQICTDEANPRSAADFCAR
jgi:hypothetical protein